MELILKTSPRHEIIGIEEVRAYLRLSSDQEEGTLPTLISAARAHIESYTGRSLLKQAWQLNLKPPYPRCSPLVRVLENNVILELPRPPLLKVNSVKVKDEEVVFQVEDGKVILSSRFWDKTISVTYWAGYGKRPEALPPDLRLAVLMVIRCLYDGQPVDGSLLRHFRVLRVV
jgi:hypothetical protein